MTSQFNNGQSKRKRVSERLEVGPRGFNILTDAGDLWVLDPDEYDNDLIGRQVVAEGVLTAFDRLHVDWPGEIDSRMESPRARCFIHSKLKVILQHPRLGRGDT
jgi:hypothetical protein